MPSFNLILSQLRPKICPRETPPSLLLEVVHVEGAPDELIDDVAPAAVHVDLAAVELQLALAGRVCLQLLQGDGGRNSVALETMFESLLWRLFLRLH